MAIPIGIEDHITNSEHHYHVFVVQDETAQAGGFLIFESWAGSKGPNPGGAFERCLNDRSGLERFFAETGWVVQWKFWPLFAFAFHTTTSPSVLINNEILNAFCNAIVHGNHEVYPCAYPA